MLVLPFRIAALTALAVSGACTLERTPLVAADAGAGADTSEVDAPDLDAPEPPADAPTCVPTSSAEAACDRVDDDCNGTIDDGGVCGGCVAFTLAGRAYLSCPGPIRGMDAWRGACRTSAFGYDLLVLSSVGERDGVTTALAGLGITDPHWIGLNDFEENGEYVWRDRTTTFVPTAIGADDPTRRYVILRSDGTYDELGDADAHRYLCEIDVAPGPCRATSEGTMCNASDDDCDGAVDDGVDCGRTCSATTFWDHVYYLCVDTRNRGEAVEDCRDDSGAPLVSIDHPTEHTFVATVSPAEAWIGLAQATNSATPDVGWEWADGSTGYGVPVLVGMPPWDVGEPNDGGAPEDNGENCGLLLAPVRGSRFDDRGCGARLPFLCERPWTY